MMLLLRFVAAGGMHVMDEWDFIRLYFQLDFDWVFYDIMTHYYHWIYIYIFTNKLPRWILWCWHNDYTYISNSCYHFYHKDGCTCTICIQCIPCIFSPQAMASELNMYESQVNEYKYEIERLARELQDVKKKYFLSRKKEQQQKYVTTIGVCECFSYLHVIGMILLIAWQPQIMISVKFKHTKHTHDLP